MNFALDATPLSVSTGGVRRYTEELACALATSFPDDQFHLISDQRFRMTRGFVAPPNLHTRPRRPRGWIEKRWWLIGVQTRMQSRGCVLFHGTDFSVPYLPLRPSVMTLHDLSPWMSKDWHASAARVRRRTPYLLRLGLAAIVIVPSQSVARQAADYFALHPTKIAVIPEAAASMFRPVPPREHPVPYFLYVGTLEPRKNLPVIIAAWREVRRRHRVDLILAGRRREDFPQPESVEGLHVLGETLDADLPSLYSGALATLYPSLYEGFGLPLLEAMQCGSPVIASRASALVEVSAGAALHVDADDTKGWAAAMMSLLNSGEQTARLRDASLRRAAAFSWSDTARQTREVYAEAIRRFTA